LYRARIKASSDSSQAQLGELTLPAGEIKEDEYFGKQEVYHHDVVGSIAVAHPGGSELSVPLKVTYQGCATAGLCYPPITKTVNVVLPATGRGPGAAGITSAAGTTSATGTNSVAGTADGGALASTGTAAGAFVSEQDQLATLIRDGNLLA